MKRRGLESPVRFLLHQQEVSAPWGEFFLPWRRRDIGYRAAVVPYVHLGRSNRQFPLLLDPVDVDNYCSILGNQQRQGQLRDPHSLFRTLRSGGTFRRDVSVHWAQYRTFLALVLSMLWPRLLFLLTAILVGTFGMDERGPMVLDTGFLVSRMAYLSRRLMIESALHSTRTRP